MVTGCLTLLNSTDMKKLYIILALLTISSVGFGQRYFNNNTGNNLWMDAGNWSNGNIGNGIGHKVVIKKGNPIIDGENIKVAQIKIGTATTLADTTVITATNGGTLTLSGEGVTAVIVNANTEAQGGKDIMFDLPVTLESFQALESVQILTANGSASGNAKVIFGSNGSLTLANNTDLKVVNVTGNKRVVFDNKLTGTNKLIIGATNQIVFGSSFDGSDHSGIIEVLGNNAKLTANVADDGTFVASGNKIYTEAASTGVEVTLNGANIYKGDIETRDGGLKYKVNKNQSGIGNVTLGAGNLDLVIDDAVTNVAFANNSTSTWGNGNINVTGFKNGVLSFGSDENGITPNQLAKITTDGLGDLAIDVGGNLNTIDLFFSEYAEGSSNNKYLEIYNPTSASISLDGYAYPNVSNAPTTVGEHENWNTFTSGATIAAGGVYIIAHGSAAANILDKADETFNFLSNGDDGFGLAKGTEESHTIIDWLGNFDGDPGTAWDVAGISNATKDKTLIRKASVAAGNTSWTASAGTNADDSEWIVKEQNYNDDLGKHTYNPGFIAPPTVQFASTTIDACEGEGTVTLTVNITDASSSTATTVDVALTTGTASSISDYTTQTLTFDAGSSDSKTVTLTIPDDSDIESAEAFVFTLQNISTGASIGNDATLTLTVSDNDYVYNAEGPNLFFSEYAEGSSNNKYLEIYNPTSETVSLDNYAFVNTSNGSDGNYEFWNNFASGATIDAGATYVVAHSSANETIKAAANETRTLYHNGDDGQALVIGSECGFTILDRIGDFGDDPGSGWEVAGVADATKDHTLVRKASVLTGNADWATAAGTNSDDSEWEVKDKDNFDDIGKHKYGVSNTAVQFSSLSANVCESDGTATLTVSITDPSATDATVVEVALTTGTAGNIGDFTTQTLTFDAGSADAKTITITIPDDSEVGNTETFVFTLQNISGGDNAVIGDNATHTLNIQDNDVESGTVDLFFSEYAEGSSFNKYLEIYNPTSEEISLDGYAYANVSNGGEGTYEYWNKFPSGAVIAAGATYVIAHKDADSSILDKANEVTTLYHNGDDGQALMKGTECGYIVLDRIGDFGEDPGNGWEVAGVADATKDHTLIRKASVATGNDDWVASAGTTADDSEWIVKEKDDFSDIGTHAYNPDSDGDGVTDDIDQCPDTPSGESVDANGCSDSQKDTDGDGVSDDLDQCPDTPDGVTVDMNGCADSQKDSDGDGVTDDIDECANTPSGAAVDAKGCELPLFVEKVSFINRIYPNPASEILKVELDNSMVLNKYVINDLNGKVIETTNIGQKLRYLEIDIKSFNNGLFILNLEFENGNSKVKFLKE